MKYILCVSALALTLASCSTSRPPAAVSPRAEARTADAGDAPALPAGVVVQPPQSTIGKLLGWPKPAAYALPALPARIGKKASITVYNAPATVTTIGKKATAATAEGAVATVIEKKAGPAVVASDSATQNTVGGDGNLAVVNGDGNTATLTKADVEPPGAGATIAAAFAQPLGKALAVLVVGGVIVGIVWWRKKKAVTDLV